MLMGSLPYVNIKPQTAKELRCVAAQFFRTDDHKSPIAPKVMQVSATLKAGQWYPRQ